MATSLPNPGDDAIISLPDGSNETKFLVRLVTNDRIIIAPHDDMNQISTISLDQEINTWKIDGQPDYQVKFSPSSSIQPLSPSSSIQPLSVQSLSVQPPLDESNVYIVYIHDLTEPETISDIKHDSSLAFYTLKDAIGYIVSKFYEAVEEFIINEDVVVYDNTIEYFWTNVFLNDGITGIWNGRDVKSDKMIPNYDSINEYIIIMEKRLSKHSTTEEYEEMSIAIDVIPIGKSSTPIKSSRKR